MADTQGITFSQMMQSPVITRIVNRIQTPLSLFQQFFGFMSGDNSVATDSVKGRDAGWDVFDATRQFASARAPGTPPRRVAKKKIGHVSAQLMRAHESIIIFDEEVYKTRPLGGQIGSTVDLRGQRHIARQVNFLTRKFRNQREWMLSRMLRGGFNMEVDGDNYKLKNYNTGATDEIQVNYQIPATNLTRMQLGTGVDILGNWSNAATDILGQLYKINAGFTRIHGRALKHIWVNSNTFLNIQNNTGLQNVAGESMTVFVALDRAGRAQRSVEGISDAGFDVVFRAAPLFTFHVYDGVLSADGETDGTSTTDMELLIPNDYAIFLPDPDDEWAGLIDGSELIRANSISDAMEIQGFGAWATPVIDPPGQELKFLDNYLPVLYNPQCVGYGYVGA